MNKPELLPVLVAIANDDEIWVGGIFQKEEYYTKKYNLTLEQIGWIQVLIHATLSIKNEEVLKRVKNY